ncbi:MAG: tetratricopeptide repeat protein [Pseudomonadota bacterium]
MKSVIVALVLVFGLSLPAYAEDLSYLAERAEEGDPEAQFVLGTLFRYGQGLEKSLPEALRWWTMAAEHGSVGAQFALGDIYSGGYKLERDYVLSYMWFDIIAQQTDNELFAPVAQSTRDALLAHMTDAQVAKAKQMSADWIAMHLK